MKSRIEVCKFLPILNLLEQEESLEEIDNIKKMLISQNEETLGFYIYFIDEIGDEIQVGDYNVSKSGRVICCIDKFIEEYEPTLIPKVQKHILDNGLRDIMNLELNDDELFQKLSAGIYTFELDKTRYQRAEQYIKDKRIELEEIDLSKQIKM